MLLVNLEMRLLKQAQKKGQRLELKLAAAIRHKGLDKHAQRMPRSGALAHLPEDIATSLPYHFECKNHERITFWSFWGWDKGGAPRFWHKENRSGQG